MNTAKDIRRFTLSDGFVDSYRDKEVPWGPLGYPTYKDRYARKLEELGIKAEGTEEWVDTCRRVVEGTFTIQKKHVVSMGTHWDNAKAQRTAKDMFDRLFNLKWTPPGRGLWMMGTSYIEERTGAGLYNCWRGDTKILTRHGFKRIDSLVGTEQEIMVASGAWVKAPINSFGKQLLYEVKLKHQNGYEKTMFATGDHRWFTRENYDANIEEVFTRDLLAGSYLQLVFGQGNKTTIPSPQGIQAGIVYGDGTRNQGRGRVVLCGQKNQQLAKYFPLNTQNSYDYISDEGSIVVDGLPAYYKEAPPTTEMRPYLYGWLMGYFAADGSVTQNGQVIMSSTNKASLELFKDIAAICGIATLPIRSESRISNLTNKESILYKMTIPREKLTHEFFLIEEHKTRYYLGPTNQKRIKTWQVVSVNPTNIVEEVYCATVSDYGHFVVEDHILSGNCAFRSTKDLSEKKGYLFGWIMDALMLGVGVGFDTLGADTITVKPTRFSDEVYLIGDDREGWVKSVVMLVDAFLTGKPLPQFDYSAIRPKGTPIKGFGGTASGPGPLIELHWELTVLLGNRVGESIKSTDIVLIGNLIGKCVVAGNVRRSAELAMGRHDDDDFLTMKLPSVAGSLNTYCQWASNNSPDVIVGMDYSKLADLSAINGEPGYIWLDNARRFGRLKDPERNDDLKVMGFNPCVEQQLEDGEMCCLVETYPAHHDTLEDYMQTLKIAYLYGKTVTLVNTHWPETNAVMLKNRRIGTSMSGIWQAFAKHGRREFFNWCDKSYQYLQRLDRIYSDWLCVPTSKRMTSIKPSGTVSKLVGATPGAHPAQDEYWICRIRFDNDSPMFKALVEAGYPHEPIAYGSEESRACTSVIEFPVKEEYFERGVRDVSMWEQLEVAAQLQHYWADNSVSVTVSFKPEEAKDIKYALELYETRLKAVSFLPYFDPSNSIYPQMPNEPITAEEYERRIANIRPLSKVFTDEGGKGERFCTNDTCTV